MLWEKIKMILVVVGIIITIVTTNLAKYEDKKNGRRWWEWK